MNIRYKIAAEDVATFNLQHLKGLPAIRKKQLWHRIIVSGIYGLVAIGLFIYEPAFWPFAWLLMFFAILWFIFYPTVWQHRLRKKILKVFKNKQYTTSEINFSSDGLFAKNNEKEVQIPWSNIKKLVHTDQHIFMYLTEDDGIIIPKAGLEKEVNWNELYEFIKKFMPDMGN